MIFHDNRLLTDNFHEMLYRIFFRKLGKMSQILLAAAVVIGALRVKNNIIHMKTQAFVFLKMLQKLLPAIEGSTGSC